MSINPIPESIVFPDAVCQVAQPQLTPSEQQVNLIAARILVNLDKLEKTEDANERERLALTTIGSLLQRAGPNDAELIVNLMKKLPGILCKAAVQHVLLRTWLTQNLFEENPFREQCIALLERAIPDVLTRLPPKNQRIICCLENSKLSKLEVLTIYEELIETDPSQATQLGLSMFPNDQPFLEKICEDLQKQADKEVYLSLVFNYFIENKMLPSSPHLLEQMMEVTQIKREIELIVANPKLELELQDNELDQFIKKMVYAKRLAVNWGIAARPDALIKYETSLPGRGLFAHAGNYLTQNCDSEDQTTKNIASVLSATPKNGVEHEAVARKVLAGEPVVVAAGWNGHATALIFHGDSVYICDRGQGAEIVQKPNQAWFRKKKMKSQVVRLKMDRNEMTEEKLTHILRQNAATLELNFSEGKSFYDHDLPSLLASTPQRDYQNGVQSSLQKVCDCEAKTRDQVVVQLYQLLSNNPGSRLTAKKKLLEYRMSLLETYLANTPKADLAYDSYLVGVIKDKLNHKIKKLGKLFSSTELPVMLANMPHVKACLAAT